MHKQYKYHLICCLNSLSENFFFRFWTTISSIVNTVSNVSDSDDERYEEELVYRCQEANCRLRLQEEQERAECQARKEARAAEKARLEEEAQKLAEEEQHWKEEEEQCQKDLAYRLEVDHATAVEQARRKNWTKTYLPPSSLPSNKKMNLINLPPLTKRQRVCYFPKETPKARQQCEELARELGASIVGGGSPCERCADFRILCISQNLP